MNLDAEEDELCAMFDESSELRVYSSTTVLPARNHCESPSRSILSCSSNGVRGFVIHMQLPRVVVGMVVRHGARVLDA